MNTNQSEQLYINGQDAWDIYGVVMGNGFLNALYAPAPMKDYVEGSSRLEHGKVVITDNARLASRDVTLTFNVHGETEDAFKRHLNSFYEVLYAGMIEIQVKYPNGEESGKYSLIYKKSTSYAQNRLRNFCTMAVKFEEPNPNERS